MSWHLSEHDFILICITTAVTLNLAKLLGDIIYVRKVSILTHLKILLPSAESEAEMRLRLYFSVQTV